MYCAIRRIIRSRQNTLCEFTLIASPTIGNSRRRNSYMRPATDLPDTQHHTVVSSGKCGPWKLRLTRCARLGAYLAVPCSRQALGQSALERQSPTVERRTAELIVPSASQAPIGRVQSHGVGSSEICLPLCRYHPWRALPVRQGVEITSPRRLSGAGRRGGSGGPWRPGCGSPRRSAGCGPYVLGA